MSKLTASAVKSIFDDCLFKEGEDTSNHVSAEGIMCKFGFHPVRLAGHKTEIAELLGCLPDQFHSDKGGGWTFLNACMDRDEIQWGEHRNIEQLVALGVATEQARYQMPREMWKMLPGGMPYFVVLR